MMQTDVKSAACPEATTNTVTDYRTRVKAIAISYGATPSSVTILDDVNGVFEYYNPAVAGSIYMLFPGEGILCTTSLLVQCGAGVTATVFYG